MIYSRLMLARNLLAEDGVIFISIDDNEQENLKKISDEVFGAQNFVAQMVWQKRTSPDARRIISAGHEYVLVYAKKIENGHELLNPLPFDAADYERYKNPDNDPNGPWISTDCTAQAGHGTKDQFYDMVTPADESSNYKVVFAGDTPKREWMRNRCWTHLVWNGRQGFPEKRPILLTEKGKPCGHGGLILKLGIRKKPRKKFLRCLVKAV